MAFTEYVVWFSEERHSALLSMLFIQKLRIITIFCLKYRHGSKPLSSKYLEAQKATHGKVTACLVLVFLLRHPVLETIPGYAAHQSDQCSLAPQKNTKLPIKKTNKKIYIFLEICFLA